MIPPRQTDGCFSTGDVRDGECVLGGGTCPLLGRCGFGARPVSPPCWCLCARMIMTRRLTENPNHSQIALFCFSPSKRMLVIWWGALLQRVCLQRDDCNCSKQKSQILGQSGTAVTGHQPEPIAHYHTKRRKHPKLLTVPFCSGFLEYLWSPSSTCRTDGFNVFKEGIDSERLYEPSALALSNVSQVNFWFLMQTVECETLLCSWLKFIRLDVT